MSKTPPRKKTMPVLAVSSPTDQTFSPATHFIRRKRNSNQRLMKSKKLTAKLNNSLATIVVKRPAKEEDSKISVDDENTPMIDKNISVRRSPTDECFSPASHFVQSKKSRRRARPKQTLLVTKFELAHKQNAKKQKQDHKKTS